MLDRVVFLVGLHRHRLLAELRQAALVHGHIFFDAAPRGLVVGEPLLGGRDSWRAVSSRASSAFEPLRFVSEPALGVVRGGVEFLQRDQSFEISVHE